MNTNQLNNIHIEGFKSIKSQDIVLTDLNVLIGQNGAGKSNFISLFRLLRNVVNQRLENYSKKVGAESLLYYGSKETKHIILDIHTLKFGYHIALKPANDDSLFFEKELVSYRNVDFQGYYPNIKETKLFDNNKTELIGKIINDWHIYHFHDTSDTAGVKKYGSISDNLFLFEDASNLAAYLYLLKETQTDYYQRIVKTVQLVVPYFKDFLLRPNPFNNETIRLEWQDRYSDKVFTANDLSDGSLRFICMAALLLQKDLPQMILLDEPELGLHPAAITILAGLLKKASRRTQVVVSTQSVGLVNEFDAGDIVVVEKRDAETVFRRLDASKLEAWLTDYSLGELWDKNIFGGNP